MWCLGGWVTGPRAHVQVLDKAVAALYPGGVLACLRMAKAHRVSLDSVTYRTLLKGILLFSSQSPSEAFGGLAGAPASQPVVAGAGASQGGGGGGGPSASSPASFPSSDPFSMFLDTVEASGLRLDSLPLLLSSLKASHPAALLKSTASAERMLVVRGHGTAPGFAPPPPHSLSLSFASSSTP